MWDFAVMVAMVATLAIIPPPGPAATAAPASVATPAAADADETPLVEPTLGPGAAPSTQTLKTIARVRSTTLCGEFATHANLAIGSTMRNDSTIGHTIGLLGKPDLDGSGLARHNEIAQLSALSDQLYREWRAGAAEIKQLRALSAKTADPSEKQDLKAFTDWIGGALWRQRKIGRDLDGFVAYLNARDMMHIDESTAQANLGILGVADPSTAQGVPGEFTHPSGPASYPAPLSINYDASDTAQAGAAAKEFTERVKSIVGDESQAASTGDVAASHC